MSESSAPRERVAGPQPEAHGLERKLAPGAGHAPAHAAHDVRAHVKVYLMVFGALAFLTIVTVAVSYLHLPVAPAIAVALLIATIKASLVALFFMHLKGEVRAIFWALGLTAVFFLALLALPLSGYLDSIGHHHRSTGSGEAGHLESSAH